MRESKEIIALERSMTNGADEVIFLVDLISVLHIFLLLNYMQAPVVWHFRSIVNKHLLRVLLNSLEIMVYESVVYC